MCNDAPGILFICTHKACRSILCEVIARELAGTELRVASAVKAHWGFIDPTAIEGSAHSLKCAFDSLAQAIELRVRNLLKAPFRTRL